MHEPLRKKKSGTVVMKKDQAYQLSHISMEYICHKCHELEQRFHQYPEVSVEFQEWAT